MHQTEIDQPNVALGQEKVSTEAQNDEAFQRREMLARINRFAYVAPAMVLLVDPANAKDEYKTKDPKPPKPPKQS